MAEFVAVRVPVNVEGISNDTTWGETIGGFPVVCAEMVRVVLPMAPGRETVIVTGLGKEVHATSTLTVLRDWPLA